MVGIAVVSVVATGGDPATLPAPLPAGTSASPGAAPSWSEFQLVEAIQASAIPLEPGAGEYDWLLDRVSDARFVLIGDASHGTHEFYRARAEMTRWLIEEAGFTAVAIEGNWTDAERVNRYVRGLGDDSTAAEALGGFGHWPKWMWRNTDVADFVTWLHAHNSTLAEAAHRAGFYGLDVYGLAESARAVIGHLEGVDPDRAFDARARYDCFDLEIASDVSFPDVEAAAARECARGAQVQLEELETAFEELDSGCTHGEGAEAFAASQNARVVEGATRYFGGIEDEPLWNVRDRHMAATLEALAACLSGPGAPARIVVWAHNTHVGDQRAMDVGTGGQVNLGQLVREAHPDETVLIGSSTYAGTVLASEVWEGEVGEYVVRPALRESYEWLFHEAAESVGPNFAIDLAGDERASALLAAPRRQRAIGVLYLAITEHISHYYEARLSDQFDVLLHFDRTRALETLVPLAPPPE